MAATPFSILSRTSFDSDAMLTLRLLKCNFPKKVYEISFCFTVQNNHLKTLIPFPEHASIGLFAENCAAALQPIELAKYRGFLKKKHI